MGGGVSFPTSFTSTISEQAYWRSQVNIEEAKLFYIGEGSLTDQCSDSEIEFRVLLDEPLAFSRLKEFASADQEELLKTWRAVLKSNKRTRTSYYTTTENSIQEDTGSISGNSLRDSKALAVCFFNLYVDIFTSFKESAEYEALCAVLNERNKVLPCDFDFFMPLGSGAFGSVFSCRKKSTGALYAMKIQPKSMLLRHAGRYPAAAMNEFLATTGCPHPFICQALYAFQTPKLVFLALPLYAYGDLRRVLLIQATGTLGHERAQFIGAELACALMFLHRNGIVHRDVKPENVFFSDSGHIVLGDLGTVAGMSVICCCYRIWHMCLILPIYVVFALLHRYGGPSATGVCGRATLVCQH
jgi:hypothetical protein